MQKYAKCDNLNRPGQTHRSSLGLTAYTVLASKPQPVPQFTPRPHAPKMLSLSPQTISQTMRKLGGVRGCFWIFTNKKTDLAQRATSAIDAITIATPYLRTGRIVHTPHLSYSLLKVRVKRSPENIHHGWRPKNSAGDDDDAATSSNLSSVNSLRTAKIFEHSERRIN